MMKKENNIQKRTAFSMTMKKVTFLVFIISLLLILPACSKSTELSVLADGEKATVFKSPTCGCCVGYIGTLESNGVDVVKRNSLNMDSVKKKYNIPRSMESCHTTILGDYFIEGHVPLEAVEKLLKEKPDIDGIALPNMPSGTPGMPGPKRGPWKIYALKNGKISDFMTL